MTSLTAPSMARQDDPECGDNAMGYWLLPPCCGPIK